MSLKNRVLIVALTLVVQVFATSPAFAAPKTKIDLVNDCGGFGPGGPCDNVGPTAGFVKFDQDDTGALTVAVSMHDGMPNTTYAVFLTCGPTIALSCGFLQIGTITTNGAGNGRSGAIVVPLRTLQAAPFGSGERADEITLVRALGDLGAGGFDQVTPLAYTVP